MSISTVSFETFNEQYDHIKFYNTTHLDQAGKYLLSEKHGGKKSSPTNGEFVSFLASKFFVIYFAEGCECMEEILDESVIQTIMKMRGIAPGVRNKMRFFGWDARKETEKMFTLFQQLLAYCSVHEWDREILKAIKENMDGIFEVAPAIASETLHTWLSLLEGKLPDVKNNCAIIHTLQVELDSEVISTFPIRTKKMTSSLNQSHDIKVLDPAETKMVWICGGAHLNELDNRPEFNLDPLREELQNHNAVTMAPRLIHATEEPNLDEQHKLALEGKMMMNYQALNCNPEHFVQEWEETINHIRFLQTRF